MKREYLIGGLFFLLLLVFLIGVTYMGGKSTDTTPPRITEDNTLPTPTAVPLPLSDEIHTVTEPVASESESLLADSIQSATSEEFWIAGYVRGEDDKILPGTKIAIHVMDGLDPGITQDQDEGNVGLATTDAKGYYTIPLGGPHEYQIRSFPPEGYLTLIERFTLTQDQPTLAKHLVHPLAPYKVKGKVIDAQTKAPIAGASVILLRRGNESHPQQQIERSTSAADGTFVIPRIAQGTFRLEARAQGYVDYNPYRVQGSPLLNIKVSEQTQNREYTIEMEPGMGATFHVVNAQGQPVENAAIKITGDQNSYDYIGHSSTDASGMATNQSLPERQLFAEASHETEGKGFSAPFKASKTEPFTPVEITLQQTASISGRVIDSDGNPVPDKQVVAEILSVENWIYPPSEQKTPDDSGNYSIANLAPGSYRVMLTKKNTYPPKPIQAISLDLTSGETRTGVDFILDKEETTEIKGKVVDEETSEPVEGVFVHAVIYEKGDILGSEGSKTDAQGEFTISLLPKGGTSIQFSLQDKEGYAHTILDRPTGESQYLLKIQKSGQIRGIVVDPNDQPLAGASVYPLRFFGNSPNAMPYNTKVSGDDGSFSFSNLDPMDYSFRATAEGYSQTDSEKVILKKGESIESVVIRMKEGQEISGIVTDPQGQPVPGALISIYSYISNNNQSSWSDRLDKVDFPENARTDGSGHFTIADFPPEGDTLVVQREKLAPTLFPVSVEMFGQPIAIRMTPGGTLAGTVYGSDGKGLQGVTMMTQNFPENLFRYETVTDQNGQYRFENLLATSYMVINNGAPEDPSGTLNASGVSVMGGGGSGIDKQQYKNASVKEGETTRCDFGGGEGAIIRGVVYKRGQIAPNAKLGLEYRNPERGQIGKFLKTFANEQGAYAFQAVEPGSYTLTVNTNPSGSVDPSECEYFITVVVEENQPEYTIDLYVASLEIQGMVTDSETNEPIVGAQIQPRMQNNVPRPQGIQLLNAQTQSDGSFTLLPQESGDYTFIAIMDGYASEEFSLTVPPFTPGEISPPVTVQVQMKKDNMGILVRLMLDDKPASTSWAHIYVQSESSRQRLQVIPQPEPGMYRAIGMQEGEMELSVTAYCNAKVMNSQPQTILVKTGETTQVLLNLIERTE